MKVKFVSRTALCITALLTASKAAVTLSDEEGKEPQTSCPPSPEMPQKRDLPSKEEENSTVKGNRWNEKLKRKLFNEEQQESCGNYFLPVKQPRQPDKT